MTQSIDQYKGISVPYAFINTEEEEEYMSHLKCPRCEYDWVCASNMIYVMCPSCRKFFEKNINKVVEPAEPKPKVKK